MSKVTAGERNNNPGCIYDSQAGCVRSYENLTVGYHALFKLLRSNTYNNKTALEIFETYAPRGHGNNNPTEYARFVINHLRSKGFDVNDSTRLDFRSNPNLLIETAIAISKQENSKVLCPPEYANDPEGYVYAQAASFYQSINEPCNLNRVFTNNGINITNPTPSTNPNTQTNNQNEQNHHKNTPSPTPTPSTNPLGAAGDQMINSLIQSVIMLALTKYMNK